MERPGRTLQFNFKGECCRSKAKGGATNYWLYDVGVQVCCCVFIQMYLSNTMLLCSHWNVFIIYTQADKFVVGFSLKCI